jgi:predicted permease
MTLSINITLPFVLLAVLGILLKRRGVINEEFIKQGNKVIFYFAIPVTLFNHIHAADLSNVFDLRFLAFNSLWLIMFFIIVWVTANKFMKDKDSVSSFVNSAYRSSLSVVGPPLLVLMFVDSYDPNILPKGILAVSILLIISYVSASVLFAVHDSKSNKNGMKGIFIFGVFMSIIKNPIIIGVLTGLLFNFLGLTLPTFANNTVDSFSRLVMPLAMICVGANLRFQGFDKKFKYVLISAFIKLVIMPISAVIVAYLFGFRGSDLTIILILNALPMAVGAYVMQAELGGDSYIGASVLMLTMTLSALTLTLYIFLFRVMGFL